MDEICVLTWKGNCLVAELAGEVDHHMTEALRKVLDREIQSAKNSPVHLVFDFRQVTFMDSSGIGAIMGRYIQIKETGGTVYVSGCDPYVERLLEMSGIFFITEKVRSVEDAWKQIERKAEASWKKRNV